MTSKLMQMARESADTDLDLNQDVQPTAVEDGDALFAQAETLDVAVEALVDKLLSLEGINLAIESIDHTVATPALARVVQAAVNAPFEQSVSVEAYTQPFVDNTIDDVVAKTTPSDGSPPSEKVKESGWQGLKGRAAAAAKAVGQAVVDAIKAIINFLKNIFDWAFGSVKSLTKTLEKQRTDLSKAKPEAVIKYNRNFKPLVKNNDFNAAAARECLATYARVTTNSTAVISDVFTYTNLFKPGEATGDASAMSDMFGRFEKKMGLKHLSDTQYSVYNGEGQSELLVYKHGDGISSASGEASHSGFSETAEFTFSKTDASVLANLSLGLLKTVAECNEGVKRVQGSLNRALALWVATLGRAEVAVSRDKSVIHLISKMRTYIAFTTKYGIGTSVKAAKATSKLLDAYMAA